MLVALGPLPSGSVLAYTKLARLQLEELGRVAPGDAVLNRDLIGRFDDFHREWEDLAVASPEFVWHRELDREEVEWVTHGFFRVVELVASTGGSPERFGEEGGSFYRALVMTLLDALERESASGPGFACNLRECWPFLEP